MKTAYLLGLAALTAVSAAVLLGVLAYGIALHFGWVRRPGPVQPQQGGAP